ncbi:low-temperature-induced 65 kDa protein-like isoform X1 [Vitis riparia]|uniref:low-temperature-induced 65 kDa protein-like isoform X1 n=1 Tax=Vitis riparia TaxID=96939 RepID=UPI00155A9B31|nr:low-temperature-induced 65 kDa protein-like isoform X1 [Vitis riparia]
MDYPQTGHPHGHHYEEDPHSVGLHSATEGEDHHEKKSVLKKVKDKAKKIKDTITKHGHGQHHDEHGQEFDEEDDEDEEMAEEPVVQGGQKYESTVIKSRTIPMEELYAGQSGPTLERTTAMKEDPLVPKDATTTPFPSQTPGKEDTSRQYGDNLGRPTAMEDHPYAPDNTLQTFSVEPYSTTRLDEHPKEGNPEKSRVNLGASMGLEEDPHAPKDRPEAVDPPNYQTKVADPTGDGGEEVGITPIISSFDKMSVQDKPEQPCATRTGSHDQFSPEPLPAETKTTEDPQDTNNAEKPSNEKTYTEKISTAAISAKNTVASKLGYGGTDKGEETHEGGDQTAKKTSSVTEYGKKIANTLTETLSPVYGKVAEAGSAVKSKVQGTGSEREGPKEHDKGSEPEGCRAPDKGVPMKAYLAEKLKPSDEDRALSEVISDALQKRKQEPEHETKSKPMGKVTESEEVARRLSTENKPSGEGSDSGDVKFDSSSNVNSGSGVVDKLRGAVNSWLGKGGDSQTRPQPIAGNEGFSTSGNGGERQGNDVAKDKRT